ncbi:hypothetical protein K469DRAFT_536308, partial [Zopfia rhizophila CBS 207.26]
PYLITLSSYVGVCYTVWNITMVATSPLYAENYGLNNLQIGLTYISNGTRSLCGSILTGKLLNIEYRRQLKRERKHVEDVTAVKEVKKIELVRIRPMIVPIALFIPCVVAFGWVVDYHAHIAVSITLAIFIGGLDTCILAAFLMLVVDLFQSQSFSVTAYMNLSHCLIAAGGTTVVQPLIQAVGVGWAFTTCASITLTTCPFATTKLYYGTRWRNKR